MTCNAASSLAIARSVRDVTLIGRPMSSTVTVNKKANRSRSLPRLNGPRLRTELVHYHLITTAHQLREKGRRILIVS